MTDEFNKKLEQIIASNSSNSTEFGQERKFTLKTLLLIVSLAFSMSFEISGVSTILGNSVYTLAVVLIGLNKIYVIWNGGKGLLVLVTFTMCVSLLNPLTYFLSPTKATENLEAGLVQKKLEDKQKLLGVAIEQKATGLASKLTREIDNTQKDIAMLKKHDREESLFVVIVKLIIIMGTEYSLVYLVHARKKNV